MADEKAKRPKPPCMKDCPDRGPSCAINCLKWAAYLEQRNAYYVETAKAADINAFTFELRERKRARLNRCSKNTRRSAYGKYFD